MTKYGFTLSSEEHDPAKLVTMGMRGRRSRIRLRLHLRPFPPLDR